MAHNYFVKLDENNIVTQTTRLEDSVGPDEATGASYLNKIYKTNDTWKLVTKSQGVIPGHYYDQANNRYIPQQPFPSWTLNETTLVWDPPVSFPEDGNPYSWDEDAYQADTANPKTQGWVAI